MSLGAVLGAEDFHNTVVGHGSLPSIYALLFCLAKAVVASLGNLVLEIKFQGLIQILQGPVVIVLLAPGISPFPIGDRRIRIKFEGLVAIRDRLVILLELVINIG